jgi:hypothetical protein
MWPTPLFGAASIAKRTLETQLSLSNLGTKWSADCSGRDHDFTSLIVPGKQLLHLLKRYESFPRLDIGLFLCAWKNPWKIGFKEQWKALMRPFLCTLLHVSKHIVWVNLNYFWIGHHRTYIMYMSEVYSKVRVGSIATYLAPPLESGI